MPTGIYDHSSRKMGRYIKCQICNKTFYVQKSAPNRKFCSKACYWFAMRKGKYASSSMTDETKHKISIALSKIPKSKEHKKAISLSGKGRNPNSGSFQKGYSPWNKNKKGISEKTRKKMRIAKLGKAQPKETIAKRTEKLKGHSVSKKTCEKLTIKAKQQWENPEFRESMTGESHPNWRGGCNPYSSLFNESLKKKIRERDNYICQLCGKTSKEEYIDINQELSVHHIRYDKNDIDPKHLITLCCSCHAKTHYNRTCWETILLQQAFHPYNTFLLHPQFDKV